MHQKSNHVAHGNVHHEDGNDQKKWLVETDCA